MNRSLYLFGIYLLILELAFLFFYAIVYFQMGLSMFGMSSFSQYYLVLFILNSLVALVLLKYFHAKGYKFCFYSALLILLTSLVNFVVLYTFLTTGKLGEYVLPVYDIFLISGIPYTISLVASKATEKPWLKNAGIFLIVTTGLLFITLFLILADSSNAGIQNLHRWIGIFGGLVLLFYVKNFSEELKEGSSEASEQQSSGSLNVVLVLIVAAMIISVFAVSVSISKESYSMSYGQPWEILESNTMTQASNEPPRTYPDSVTESKTKAVEMFGHLQVDGNRIVGSDGEPVQLRGLSLFWSQWIWKYYNYDAVRWLRDDWKINIIRVAMAVDQGGYATNREREMSKVISVVDAAIDLGIYVIVDFHAHHADDFEEEAKEFFTEIAQRYGHLPNVIYEPWNEPVNDSWKGVIKPYHEEIIRTIRKYDEDNLVVCGTRNWSQKVKEASLSPIEDVNVAYTLHYYAATPSHQGSLRREAQAALDNGAALFVTEYGMSNAPKLTVINEKESKLWWEFLDENYISHCKWSVGDKRETTSILVPGAPSRGGWTDDQITRSGQLVREEIRAKNP